jgi:predicted RNase H-like nuclease (RuvC/YqgF family)
MTLSQLQRDFTNRSRVDCLYTGEKTTHPKGEAKQKESEEYQPHVPIYSNEEWAEGKTKAEITEKYSALFDSTSDKKVKFLEKEKNIKDSTMTDETKKRKIEALYKTIKELEKEIKEAYKEYRKDLKTAGIN